MKFNSLLCLLIIVCLSSCADPEANDIVTFDEELNLSISQIPTPDGPHVSFELTSLDGFDCENTLIQSVIQENSESLVLDLISIHIPEECNTGLHPAYGYSSANLDVGTYNFNIKIGELISENGRLAVTPNGFELKVESIPGLNIVRSAIQRLPDEHVWGKVNFQSLSSSEWNSFVNGIGQYTAVSTEAEAANYGLFEIDELKNIFLSATPVQFIFLEVTDLTGLEQFLDLFRAQHPDFDSNLTHSSGIKI